jgi:hypothetical protein
MIIERYNYTAIVFSYGIRHFLFWSFTKNVIVL